MGIAKNHRVVIALLGALGASGAASAAQITWGSQSLIFGPSDVVTQGSLVYAYSLGNNVAPFVNGVLFGPAQSHNGSPDYDFADSNVLLHNYTFYQGFGTPPTVSDSQYGNLLDNAGYAPNDPQNNPHNDIVFTLNVTQGQTYLLQLWANDGRQGDHVGTTQTLTDSSGGAAGNMTVNEAYGTSGFGGTFLTGTFKADAGTEVITIDGTDEQQINAFQLRNITVTPEPTTAIVFGMGAMGLLSRRRRRI
jgi:hypothetical protein